MSDIYLNFIFRFSFETLNFFYSKFIETLETLIIIKEVVMLLAFSPFRESYLVSKVKL